MEKIYTVKQTAKILGFSTNTVYKYLDDGVIEAARGAGQQGRYRISHVALETFLGTPLTQEQVEKTLTGQEPSPFAFTGTGTAQATLPASVARVLLLASLLMIVIDLIVAREFSLTTQLLRMALIAVFVLLAYQSGGFNRVSKPDKSSKK